jgi:DNA-binding response OmpR family regulator
MVLTDRDVLIVDDDPDYSAFIAELLRRVGVVPRSVPDGFRAIAAARAKRPDLVLLDLSLPKIDGSSLVSIFCNELRVPVIVVSGRSALQEIVANLEQGADDYVVKPVRGEELIARMQAVLRRVEEVAPAHEADEEVYNFGDLIIDVGSKQVALRGQAIRLTPRELSLLVYLVRHPHRSCSRQEILEQVWHSSEATSAASTVNEHVRRLRLKLEVDPVHPEHIVTVPGFGYRFDPPGVRGPAAGDTLVPASAGEA